ncbi:MAG: DCC1-like thiol-disulfide oxidoreductase family protein [Akkermansiaceae bacterium]
MKKVNLDKGVKKVEVFYDGGCGMCRTFMGWLERQERGCELVCLDYRGEEARDVFPGIGDYEPEKEIVVRMEQGDGECEVYVGGEGWVCCLWSCGKYRDLAEKMNGCVLLPLAKKVCYLVSRNRLGVSRLFFRRKNAEIAAELEKEAEVTKIGCEGGCE